MPENIRALIVVLVLAAPAFYISRQLASSIITHEEFAIWRKVWFAATIVAFISLDFLVYITVLVALCLYARAARAASLGLFFILLFVVPNGRFTIGGAGLVNQILDLSNARVLVIIFLLPILFATRGTDRHRANPSAVPDWLVVGYAVLVTVLQYRSSEATITSLMRDGTSYILDVLIPYFAFSRALTSLADVRKVFLAFVIAVLPLSLIAPLELVKGWHIYGSVAAAFGTWPGYLERDGMLRATASAFGSISLGFIIMVALGCMLGIWQMIRSSELKAIVFAIFAAGLIATLSRGPWVGTATLLLVHLAVGPGAIARLWNFAVIGLVLLLALPSSARLLDFLPFIGTVDAGSVAYRQDLYDHAMVVIERYPLFGTPDYRKTPEMIDMMQGEHIIDIVNTYLEIALRSGLVSLGLFVGTFATILLDLRRMLKSRIATDVNFRMCVSASIAILTAMLVTIATVSSIDSIPYIYWSLAGLGAAIIRIGYREQDLALSAVYANRVPT
jgi:hypothetical protein